MDRLRMVGWGLAILGTLVIGIETYHILDWWLPNLANDPIGALESHADHYIDWLMGR